jgi:hypothetical protein
MALRSMPHDAHNGPGRTMGTVNEKQEAAPTCHTPETRDRLRPRSFVHPFPTPFLQAAPPRAAFLMCATERDIAQVVGARLDSPAPR